MKENLKSDLIKKIINKIISIKEKENIYIKFNYLFNKNNGGFNTIHINSKAVTFLSPLGYVRPYSGLLQHIKQIFFKLNLSLLELQLIKITLDIKYQLRSNIAFSIVRN